MRKANFVANGAYPGKKAAFQNSTSSTNFHSEATAPTTETAEGGNRGSENCRSPCRGLWATSLWTAPHSSFLPSVLSKCSLRTYCLLGSGRTEMKIMMAVPRSSQSWKGKETHSGWEGTIAAAWGPSWCCGLGSMWASKSGCTFYLGIKWPQKDTSSPPTCWGKGKGVHANPWACPLRCHTQPVMSSEGPQAE